MIDPYSIQLPMMIEFGRDVSAKVGDYAKRLGKTAFIVTDKGVVQAGILDRIEGSLVKAGISRVVFDEVIANPTDELVHRAAAGLEAHKCDFIVAVGGGSSMDTAKAIALLGTNPGKVGDYVLADFADLGKIKTDPLHLITIPTTAGTGSEVDFWAVITITEKRMKFSIGQGPMYPGGPYLGATVCLVDPLLTLGLPRKLTASTGVDALSHAVETYVAKGTNPFVESLALRSIELVATNLPTACNKGDNVEAREAMMLASHFAGICENFANCGGIHSLAEATGGVRGDIPHGVAIAVYFPHVMEYNLPEAEAKFAKIAEAMGEKTGSLSVRNAAEKAIVSIRKLIKDLDMPTSLRGLGVTDRDLDAIAERAMWDMCTSGNPREIGRDQFLSIAKKAFA
jgi:alcohol dehydrogenase class IV